MGAEPLAMPLSAARAATPSGRSPQAVSGIAGITIAADFDLTALLESEGIVKVERFVNRWSVVLFDGRQASDFTVGGALEKAKLPGANNIRRMA